MTDFNKLFNQQEIELESEKYHVRLIYQKEPKDLAQESDKILLDSDNEGILLVIIDNKEGTENRGIIKTRGGFYLLAKDERGAQSIKLEKDYLYLSLETEFICINLLEFNIHWNVEPDRTAVFEFYDIDNDFLLRGELEIHRISKNGDIVWSFGGKDIFVNMDGEDEVKVMDNFILLTDFDNNSYQIDFNGKLIERQELKTTPSVFERVSIRIKNFLKIKMI